jgi:UDP-glucose 4-epimerase
LFRPDNEESQSMNQLSPKPKRALITGGAGFIGSHLAEYLIDQGQMVHVVDDLSTGSIENLDALRDNPNFSHTIADVREEQTLAELVDRSDVVFHLAAAVGVRLIVESPVRTIETNVGCTEVVLKMANKKRKKVIVASTSEVYGKNEAVPFREDHDLVMGPTVKARWAYACSKAIDEFLALAYWKARRLPVVVTRLFNTVGPRQTGRYGMVLPNFVRQALMGQPITVFGDGKQSRCFSAVDEVVHALAALAECPEAVGQVVNVGSDQEISIAGLAELVKEMTGSDSSITYVPYEQAYEEGFEDMARRVPDVAKLASLVGFTPQKNIEDIVSAVIAFYRKR